MGGRAFRWRQETGVTPAARMRRVEVSVFLKGDDSTLAKLTGFVEQTATRQYRDRIRIADGAAR